MLLLFAAYSVGSFAQSGAEPRPAKEAMGGSATGGVHSAIFDQEHRPITAGGFVATGPIVFADITKSAGLSSWTHTMGSAQKSNIVEAVGSGVALLDYDHDGWLDIYLVNGSTAAALDGEAPAPKAALFHNNHDGTFTNVAETAGVTNDRWGCGAVVGDFDNDGWPDIYVSNWGVNRLYRNNHDGTFTDVAVKAGVALSGWSTGATWGDYDQDGFLDLFVPGYVHVDRRDLAERGTHELAASFCTYRGVQVMCGPRGLLGESDHLFHNNGDGTFKDVSSAAGVADIQHLYGLASAFLDLNGTGRVDLVVANDSTPNYLYVNEGHGTFRNASYESGYALNEAGRETASMGIASGDVWHTGRLDLYNTTFSDDYNPLYRNDGGGNFTDVAYERGVAAPTIPFLGWGTGFFDFDNDGWLDLFVANGHVYPAVDGHPWGTSYAQRPLLFQNHKGTMSLLPAVSGSGLASVVTGRGMAFGDLFNDGQIDVVINNIDAPPTLLRNVWRGHTARPQSDMKPNHWIAFELVGGPKSPRDAVGAAVYLTAGGFTQRADVVAGGSFASSTDQRPHFGLGTTSKIEALEIQWPDGVRQKVTTPVDVDRFYRLIEGQTLTPLDVRPR